MKETERKFTNQRRVTETLKKQRFTFSQSFCIHHETYTVIGSPNNVKIIAESLYRAIIGITGHVSHIVTVRYPVIPTPIRNTISLYHL